MAGHSASLRQNYRHAKKPSRDFKIFINEGEMGQIKKWTLMKDEIETGGDLFGLWIDKHTAVVQFVLGPGQCCKRTPVSFFQDTKYLESAGTFLTKNHGLCNIGQWHSHHRLSLNTPSGGDKNTVWGNMPELHLNRYIVFIANIASTNEASVNCFLFEIQSGERLPVLQGNFDELAGNSPFRDDEKVSKSVLQGHERCDNGERSSNKTDAEIENESKLEGTKLAKTDGIQTSSLNGLKNDESERSESRPKTSTPNEQKREHTYSQKREKHERQLVTTTASELPSVTCVKKNQTAPLQQQTTPSRQQQTTTSRQQQTTPSRQQQTASSRQQQTTPSRQQDASYTDKCNWAPNQGEVNKYTSFSHNKDTIFADQKVQLTSYTERKDHNGPKSTDQTVPQEKLETSKRRLSSYDNCKERDTTDTSPTESNIPPQTSRNKTPEKTSVETPPQEPWNEKPGSKKNGKRGSCCCIS